MENATKEIFITCWFLSPELYLIRDPFPNPAYPVTLRLQPSFIPQRYRLDYLLQRKAKEGVHVYIILWEETKIAMFKGSRRAQEMLEAQPNVCYVTLRRSANFTPRYM